MFSFKAVFAIISFIVVCGLLQRGQDLHPGGKSRRYWSLFLYSKGNQMRVFHVKTSASASSFISVEVCTTNHQLAKPNGAWHFNVPLLKVLGLGRFPPSVYTGHQDQRCSNFAPFMLRATIMQIYHALSSMCASMFAASVRSRHACDLLPVAERPQPPGSCNILSIHKL